MNKITIVVEGDAATGYTATEQGFAMCGSGRTVEEALMDLHHRMSERRMELAAYEYVLGAHPCDELDFLRSLGIGNE